MKKRDFISLHDWSAAQIAALLQAAADLKAKQKAGVPHALLPGKTLALIFEKPSLRTRVTFEAGMTQLGGHAIYLAPQDIRLGERETVADAARNLSRWVDGIVATCMERGLLILTAGDTVLRLVPPLILSEAEADEGLAILEGVLGEAA